MSYGLVIQDWKPSSERTGCMYKYLLLFIGEESHRFKIGWFYNQSQYVGIPNREEGFYRDNRGDKMFDVQSLYWVPLDLIIPPIPKIYAKRAGSNAKVAGMLFGGMF